jgi:hypothetical protein
MSAAEVAAQLLDAQVEYVLGELRGPRLAEAIERDVDDVLAIAATIRVDAALEPDTAKAILRRLVETVGGAPIVTDLVAALSDALYDLAASEAYTLGEVVGRAPVEGRVVKLLSMQQLHDRALDRLAESPIVATVAARFVGKIVSDFVDQNRQFAERLPGGKSLFAFGTSAASRVMNNPLVGSATEKGTKIAIKRTNSAIRDLLREAPLHGAAMEVWDLHADEPISELRGYLSQQDLRELALIVHALVNSVRGTEYAGEVLDECVDVFFERYGERDVASLLPELGLARDDIVHDLQELLPPIVAAAEQDGRLAALVRERLAPFFASAQVRAILDAG